MEKKDAEQAAPILRRSLDTLVSVVPAAGRNGSDLRRACGALSANAEALIQSDMVGPPLSNCFDLAFTCGATDAQLAIVRNGTLAETPTLLGAMLIKNAIVRLCLGTEGAVIAGTTFTSRADIDALQAEINAVFAIVEETAADDMDQAAFQALVALHAAIIYFLVETERAVPRLVRFMFYKAMPTLVTAMRLYSDARRADELRDENKVVHPAFMRPTGVGMAS